MADSRSWVQFPNWPIRRSRQSPRELRGRPPHCCAPPPHPPPDPPSSARTPRVPLRLGERVRCCADDSLPPCPPPFPRGRNANAVAPGCPAVPRGGLRTRIHGPVCRATRSLDGFCHRLGGRPPSFTPPREPAKGFDSYSHQPSRAQQQFSATQPPGRSYSHQPSRAHRARTRCLAVLSMVESSSVLQG